MRLPPVVLPAFALDACGAGPHRAPTPEAGPSLPPQSLQGFDIDIDIDLAKAVGDKLGVTIEFDNAKFDSIITGIVAGRYDLAFSSFTDNPKRAEGGELRGPFHRRYVDPGEEGQSRQDH